MNEQDYAIVVGIRRYPTFKPPVPGNPYNLDGPDTDASEIYDWLTNPAAGGVPQNQAMRIRSMDFPDPFPSNTAPEPSEQTIAGAINWLLAQPRQWKGRYTGRRFYLYFSGHGFSQSRRDGGIYTAGANPTILSHFWVTAWFDKLYEAALFEEYVLWFDACVSKIPISAPQPPNVFLGRGADYDRCREFSAFAARHPKKAVERTMPDGKVHGAFTYALLKGLNGEAVDAGTGLVTSSSLRNHLINTMMKWMSDSDRENPNVSNEPGFGPLDDLVLAQIVQQMQSVKFRFSPSAEGSNILIENGHFQIAATGVVENGAWQTKLKNGHYRLSVENTGDTLKFSLGSDQNAVFNVP